MAGTHGLVDVESPIHITKGSYEGNTTQEMKDGIKEMTIAWYWKVALFWSTYSTLSNSILVQNLRNCTTQPQCSVFFSVCCRKAVSLNRECLMQNLIQTLTAFAMIYSHSGIPVTRGGSHRIFPSLITAQPIQCFAKLNIANGAETEAELAPLHKLTLHLGHSITASEFLQDFNDQPTKKLLV